MRILSITAQKPDSTGSGVYLSELVKEFKAQGHEQAVVAGIYKEDKIAFYEKISVYPVYFKTDKLPFAIAGMSDEMPYESTVYGKMTEEMIEQFEAAFREVIRKAVEEFNPDVIICHHLYLVTALTRELCPEKKVFGFCHNTDLRQMKKIELKRDYIKKQIQRLDGIFSLHEEQKEEIKNIYEVSGEKIQIVGAGYNQHIFNLNEREQLQEEKKKLRFIFAGKIAEKKGVISLLRSLSYLPWEKEAVEVVLAGGYGNEVEGRVIEALAQEAPYSVQFLGKLSQEKLSMEYQKSDIFVLPSFYEGFPNVAIESQASSLPIFMSSKITDEACFSRYSSRISLNVKEKKWANDICNLLENYPERKNMSNEMDNIGHNIDKIVEWYEQFYINTYKNLD